MADEDRNRKTVGALIFEGFELLDLFGPLEMFGLLPETFTLSLVAEGREAVASAQGPRAQPDESFADGTAYDVLLVPGGRGTRQLVDDRTFLDWLSSTSQQAEITSSVCTGAPLLARAGLLDGRRATTNKLAWAWATSQGPKVLWQPRARWVVDGPFFTASGVSAGMDMSLALIAALTDEATADQVAVWAEYNRQHDPSDDPFAEAAGL